MEELKNKIDELFLEMDNKNYSINELKQIIINYLYKKIVDGKLLSNEDTKLIEILFK